MEVNTSDQYAQGMWSGHLETANYLFADGHVKALKPMATLSPDMWGWNIYNTTGSPIAAYSVLSSDTTNGIAAVFSNSFLYR
jgi:prepilin-type processing-associated H-X9-DG protein